MVALAVSGCIEVAAGADVIVVVAIEVVGIEEG